jgi:hypothetical protein
VKQGGPTARRSLVDAAWVIQLVEKSRGCPWTLLEEEQPYVFFPNNLDGRNYPVW